MSNRGTGGRNARSTSSSGVGNNAASSGSGNAATSGGSFGGRTACFKCGMHTHLGDECGNEGRTDMDCYNCHKPGHIGWECSISCCLCKFRGHRAVDGCKQVICFNCPGERHNPIECPRMNPRQPPPPPL